MTYATSRVGRKMRKSMNELGSESTGVLVLSGVASIISK